MNREEFTRVVNKTVAELPEKLRREISNVAIVVEEWPDKDTLDMAGVDDRRDLLGFYYGIPLTERTSSYGMVLPDKISLFRRPILLECRSEAEVAEAIRHTLIHELAHYFGIDDDRLEEIGAY